MKEGWKTVPLGNVSQVVNGGTPKTKVAKYWGGGHPWITPAEMGSLSTPYLSKSRRKLTDAGLNKSSASLVPPNSVILSTRAPIGHLVINTVPMAFNQGCRALIPKNGLYYKYLYYFLFGNVVLLNNLGTGATFKELSSTKLKNIDLPLPTFPEQKRIVAILDEAFAGLETAVANTEKNLANARELFDSYLNSVFTQQVAEWGRRKLEDLCERITKGSSPKWQGIQYVDEPGILFITSENVGLNCMVFKKIKYVEEAFNKKDAKSILKKGDVLTNIVGASIGRTAIFDKGDLANINQTVCLLRCNPEKLNNRFLSYLLNSPFFRQILHDNEINNARANLTQLHGFLTSFSAYRNFSSNMAIKHQPDHNRLCFTTSNANLCSAKIQRRALPTLDLRRNLWYA